MAQKRPFQRRRKQNKRGPGGGFAPEPLPAYVPKPKVTFADPIIVLEDGDKRTHTYASGAWIPFEFTIAQCREMGQVKVLSQQIHGRTRYEVRLPI